ncbi:MAG TPA: glutathione S-transferase family protein [Rhodanobacteraceae bacterium]|jgi:glutathione S-transferase|nr:glutathione S-transferase family protein [Rhodanobacteraceae bacterium]
MSTFPATFFHAPNSRSAATRALFEELGVPFDMVSLDLKRSEQRSPEYLAINPMGKVPAIRHEGALVTEQPAIMLYLADLYPERQLAPALDDPLRGPYLRWMVFYGSCFEPAIMDFSAKREPMSAMQCGYGDYDSVMRVLAAQLEHGPWLLGERFTAADVLWGGALNFALMAKLVPDWPVFRAYAGRVQSRPAIRRAFERDQALAREQAEALAA